MEHQKGFTLIEILIALTVFAVLASITSSSLYYAFNTRSRVNAQSEQLGALQLTVSILQQETTEILERAVRGNNLHIFPAFVGQAQYFEFTHDGAINPQSIEKRSTLKRVAFLCEDGKLLHRTWESLDPIDRNTYEDRVLLDNSTACHFNYINQNGQPLQEWREQAVTQNQHKELLPKAIQINITLTTWGELNLLFAIPGAVYASA